MDSAKMPWRGIREFLLRINCCQSRSELMLAACREIQALIPYDASAGVFSTLDLRHLEGVGPPGMVEPYNSYYRHRHVFAAVNAKEWDEAPFIVDWRRFGSFEFAVDFMWPNGIWKSLQHTRTGQQIVLSVNRSRSGPDFSERELNILGIVNEYLNSLHASFEARREAPEAVLSTERIAERFHALTSREAEICSLVARRFTTAEIAACLAISPRTVENHVQSTFDKLDVRSREQLRWCLGVCPPAQVPRGQEPQSLLQNT